VPSTAGQCQKSGVHAIIAVETHASDSCGSDQCRSRLLWRGFLQCIWATAGGGRYHHRFQLLLDLRHRTRVAIPQLLRECVEIESLVSGAFGEGSHRHVACSAGGAEMRIVEWCDHRHIILECLRRGAAAQVWWMDEMSEWLVLHMAKLQRLKRVRSRIGCT
jgi:hypothetical protein